MLAEVSTIYRVTGTTCAIALLIALGVYERRPAQFKVSQSYWADGGAVVRSEALLMGTTFAFTVWTVPEQEPGAARAIQETIQLVHALEGRISSWRPDSETSAINAAAGKEAVAVSEDLMALIRASLKWAERSEGAFDATGGPLFDLWNRMRKMETVPTEEAIRDCMDTVGYDKVRVTENTVFLTEPEMRLGFGGIGKGFAADRAAAHLKAQGFPNFIIDAGGDLVIAGSRGGTPWEVAIRHPRSGRFLASCPLGDGAVATSGDYENYFMADSLRYSHIIDPRTGMPTQGVASVTVFAARGVDADPLATAVFVLGVDAGLALVNTLSEADALLIDEHGTMHLSDGLRFQEGKVEWVR